MTSLAKFDSPFLILIRSSLSVTKHNCLPLLKLKAYGLGDGTFLVLFQPLYHLLSLLFLFSLL